MIAAMSGSSEQRGLLASLEIARPPCPVCGWRLWLSGIEIMSSSTEQHSYICPLCDHTEQRRAPRWREAG
jgi:hypothetical protein